MQHQPFGRPTLAALALAAAGSVALAQSLVVNGSFESPGSGAWGSLDLDAVSVTAVPEPSSTALLLAGLAAVGAAARRRTH